MSEANQSNETLASGTVAAGVAAILETGMQIIEKAGLADQFRDMIGELEVLRQRLTAVRPDGVFRLPVDSSQQPAPDFGEPWQKSTATGFIDTRHGDEAHTAEERMARVISCVNACAGMVDPAVEIQALRTAIKRAAGFLNAGSSGHFVRSALAELQPFCRSMSTPRPTPETDAARFGPVVHEAAHPDFARTLERDEVRSERDQLSRDLSSLLTKDCLDGHDAVEGRSNGIALRALVAPSKELVELPLVGDLAIRNSAVYAKWKAVQAALVNIKEQAKTQRQ